MNDSFPLRLVMTCADNIRAVQQDKRACPVKCTLRTQSQEATKTNGTTLTESRGKNDLRTAWIYPRPSGSTAPSRRTIPLNSSWCRWRHSAFPVRRSTCSFKLIYSSPGFAVLNHPRSRLPQFVPGPVPGSSRNDKSASTARHPVGVCQTAVLGEPFTIFRTRVRSTLRTLEFWLFVRLNVNLRDVLNLSSISADVLDLSFP